MCTIPGNPDIAGIGVRIAIYIQNLLCFLPALWALWDGEVTQEELDSAETQTTTNLVLAFAILISSIVQALTLGLSNFHTNIVLSMSWMNNTNAFIYFLLYIQHKRRSVKPTWAAWYAHVRTKFNFLLFRQVISDGGDESTGSRYDGSANGDANPASLDASGRQGAKILVKRFVILLGSLHLTLMSGLGIWLWRNLIAFGTHKTKEANGCAASTAFVVILGQAVPMAADALRICSLALYALFLIPGVNLIPPMALFLCLYFWIHRRYPVSAKDDGPAGKRAALPIFVGLLVLLVVNIIFIIDIETTLKQNKDIQDDNEETEWGFGQILAILLLFLPFRDLVETLLARRAKRRQAEIAEELRGALGSEEIDAVARAVARGANLKMELDAQNNPPSSNWMLIPAISRGYYEIVKVLLQHPTTDVNFIDESGSTALMVACSMTTPGLDERQTETVRLLLQRNIDTNVADRYGRTALMEACLAGRGPVVQLLLTYDPNGVSLQNAKEDTAPHLASFARLPFRRSSTSTNEDSCGRNTPTRALQSCIESPTPSLSDYQPTDVNLQDKNGDSALHLALSVGHMSIAMALLQHPDIDANGTNIYGRTVLMRASFEGHEPVVRHLLERPTTDVNQQDKQGDSALNLASFSGHTSIAAVLLQCPDIDTNICNKDGSTALMIASFQGHEDVVRQLINHQTTDINLQDSEGDSALIEAARNGHFAVVELLLNHPNVDTDLRDEKGQTASQIASSKGHERIVQLISGSRRAESAGEASRHDR